MPLSTELSQNLQLLEKLDPNKFAIVLKNHHLDKVNRRSDLCNFLCYFIYIITFTLVARNPKLDRAAKYIFNAVRGELSKSFSEEEKALLSKSLSNLRVVIQKNGGCNGKMARRILEAVKKIKIFSKEESEVNSPLRPITSPLADLFIARMEANPPSSPDVFFESLVSELLEGSSFEGLNRYATGNFFSKNTALKKALPKIAEHVFQNGSLERKEILVQKLHAHLVSFIIELIPVEIFASIEPEKLLVVAEEVVGDHLKAPNEAALSSAARMLEKVSEERREGSFNESAVWYFLLPYFTPDFQKGLLAHFLKLYVCPSDLDFDGLFAVPVRVWEEAAEECIAEEVVASIWVEASEEGTSEEAVNESIWESANENAGIPWKSEYKKFPQEIIYAITVKQVKNKVFLSGFFEEYFRKAKDKGALIDRMTPEFIDAAFAAFKMDQFSQLKVFLEALKGHRNQKHAQNILERVAIALFDLLSEIPAENGLALFKTFYEGTTSAQRELLGIDNFKRPETRLFFACITERLGALEFSENVHQIDEQGALNLVVQLNFLEAEEREGLLLELISKTKEENPLPVHFIRGLSKSKALPDSISIELLDLKKTLDLIPETKKTPRKIAQEASLKKSVALCREYEVAFSKATNLVSPQSKDNLPIGQ